MDSEATRRGGDARRAERRAVIGAAGEPTSYGEIAAAGVALLVLVFVIPPLTLAVWARMRSAWRDVRRPLP